MFLFKTSDYPYIFRYPKKRIDPPFTLRKFSAVVELLLKYAKDLSIDFEARDNKGRTPMHYMFQARPKMHVLQFLQLAKTEYNIEFDLKVTDHDGKIPIELSDFPSETESDSDFEWESETESESE